MNSDMWKWTTVSTGLVKSPCEREPDWIEWSVKDSWYLNHGMYSSSFVLYKPVAGAADADSVLPIDHLTGSLSKVLEHFYPFTGRLIKPEKDKVARLFCNNAGALFTHKCFDGIVSDLMDVEQFQPNELISGLYDVHPAAEVFDASGLPTLIIQVTDFKCGTRCLSFSWSHAVADGVSGAHFLRSWAQIARGEPISLMPVHDRSLLAPRESSRVLDGGPCRFVNNVIKEPGAVEFTVPDEGLGYKTFHLSGRRINELKAEALRDSEVGGLSTANCIAAHLWRLITQARGHGSHEMTRFLTLVNCRPRLKDFPAGYFGNFVIPTVSVLTVGELLSNSLSHAATVIQKSVKELDEVAIRDNIDWSAASRIHPSTTGKKLFMPGDPRANLHTVGGSWLPSFPFYELDFGGEKPSLGVFNGFRMSAVSAGMYYAFPTRTYTNRKGDLSIILFGEKNMLGQIDEL
ncbi:hypothetical protein R1sor_004111 [Riccia sorocarpa]|uniref:Acyltransferase n=1 Tax=Riccia sorocarpa TaxID=122646 RepID=A0ABD3H9N2_9MARC